MQGGDYMPRGYDAGHMKRFVVTLITLIAAAQAVAAQKGAARFDVIRTVPEKTHYN